MPEPEKVEDAQDDADLPFVRWFIKLIIEKLGDKLVDRFIFPALIAAGVSGSGWYGIGQYQVEKRVKEQVEIREAVREIVDDFAVDDDPLVHLVPIHGKEPPDPDVEEPPPEPEPIDLDDLREAWEERYEDAPNAAQMQFPEELIQQRLETIKAKKK